MNLLDLVVNIKAEDQASSKIEGISSKAVTLGSAIGTTLGSLASAGIQKAAGAIIDFGKESIQTGMNFDSAMSQVAATMGLTTADIGDLTACAKEMGATTAFSATEAAKGLNYMALAGYSSEDAIKTLPTVLNLAAAGGMELASASDMVTDAQTALGLSLEDTTKMVDQMAKTSSKSNTSVSQLGDAILTVGPNAKVLAGGTKELNTVLGLLADNGIKGSEAGTKLRNMIMSLSAPTDTAAKTMRDLGVSATDAEGNMRPLEDIMRDFNDAFAEMTQEEKTQALNKIFNKTDLAAVNSLLDTSVDRWQELGDAIEDSAGSAEKMAQTQLDNLAGDVTLLQSALEGVQIELAAGATPALREMTQIGSEGLSKMAEQLRNGDLTGGFVTLGQTVANVASVFLQALPSMVDAGMKMLFGFIQGFGEGLPVVIPSIIQAVLGIVDALIANIPLVINAGLQIVIGLVEGIIGAIPVIVAAIPQLITTIVQALVSSVGVIIQAGIQLLSALIDAIPIVIPTIIAAIPSIIQALVSALMQGIPQLIAGAIQLFTAILIAVPQIIAVLVPMIPQIIMALVEALASSGAILIDAFVNIFSQLPAAISEPLMAVGQFFMDTFNLIASIVMPIVETIGGGIAWLADTMGTILGPAIDAVGGLFGTVADGIGMAWDFITGKTAESSAETADTAKTNIQDMSDSVSGSVSNMESDMAGSLDNMLSNSQSTFPEIYSVGSSNIENLYADGANSFSNFNSEGSANITDLSGTVNSETSNMASTTASNIDSMQSSFTKGMNKMQSDGTNSMNNLTKNVSSSAKEMESSINSSFNNISKITSNAFKGIATDAESQMKATSQAVTSSMNDATNTITQATSKMTSSMQSGCKSMTSTWSSMKFSTPHIPLPHFSVSGRLDPNVPSVPSFSVSWYKQGAILDGATIFGMMGNKLLGGGEAGKEAVLPIDKLKDYVRDGVRAEMNESAIEKNFIFNITVNSKADAFDAGRKIAESIYTEMQRMELNYA